MSFQPLLVMQMSEIVRFPVSLLRTEMGTFAKKKLEIAYYSNVIFNWNISYLRSKIVRKQLYSGPSPPWCSGKISFLRKNPPQSKKDWLFARIGP